MRVPLGYHRYATLTAAVDLTDGAGFTIPAGARYVLLAAEVQAVRWLDTGGTPTASSGNLLPAGIAPWEYWGPLTALKFIAASAGAILNATFYK